MPSVKKNNILLRLASRPAAASLAAVTAVAAPSVEQQAVDLRLFLVETHKLVTDSTVPADQPIPEAILLSLRGWLQRRPRDRVLSSLEQMSSLGKLLRCLTFVLERPEETPENRILQFIAAEAEDAVGDGIGTIGNMGNPLTLETWKKEIASTWAPGLCPGLSSLESVKSHLDSLSFTDVLVLGAIKKLLPLLPTLTTIPALEKKFKEIIELPSALRGPWNHCIFYNLFHTSFTPENLSVSRSRSTPETEPLPEVHFPLTTLKAYVAECFFYTSAAQEISSFCRRHAWDYLREALAEARKDALISGIDPSAVVLHEQYLRKMPKHFLAVLPSLVWTLRTLEDWDAFLRELDHALVTHPEMIIHLVNKVRDAAPRTNFLLGNLQDFLVSVRHPIARVTTKYKEKDMSGGGKITVIERRGFRRMRVDDLQKIIQDSPDLLAAYEAAGYSTDVHGKTRPRHLVHAAPSRIRALEVPIERKRSLLRTQPWLKHLCVRDLLVRVMDAEDHLVLESTAYVVDPRMPTFTLPEDAQPVFRVSDHFLDSFFEAREETHETPQLVFHVSTGLLETTAGVQARVYLHLVNGEIVPMTYDQYLKQNKFFQEMETLSTTTTTTVSSRWIETPVLEVNMEWMQTIRKKQVDRLRGVLDSTIMLPNNYVWDTRGIAAAMDAHHFQGNPSLQEYLKRGEKIHMLFDRFSKLSPLLVLFYKRLQLGALYLERLGTTPWSILIPELMVLEVSIRDKIVIMIEKLVDAGVQRNLTSILAVSLFPEFLNERKRTHSTTSVDITVLPVDYPAAQISALVQSMGAASYASLVWDEEGNVYNADDVPRKVRKEVGRYVDLDVLESAVECTTGTLFFSDMMRYLVPTPSGSTHDVVGDDEITTGEDMNLVTGSTSFIPGLEQLLLEELSEL